MVHQIWICVNVIGIILLTTRIKADAIINGTETVKASVLVSDNIKQIEPPPSKSNETLAKDNKTVEMHRITQPIAETHSPTQPVGRTLIPAPTNASNNQQKGYSKTEFRPSPQLDTYYEYNRFPVVPALPEAKQFAGINLSEKPIRSETLPWIERPITNFPSSTQQPWYNKINFPTTQNPYLPPRNQPYPYLYSGGYPETTTKVQYPYVVTGTNSDSASKGQYPYVINHETTTKGSFGERPSFSKFGGYPPGNSAGHGGSPGGFTSKFSGFDKGGGGGGGGIGGGGGGGLFDKGSLFGGDKGSLFGGGGKESLFGGDKGSLFGGGGKGSLFGGDKESLFGGGGKGGLGGGGGGSLQKTQFEGSHSLSGLEGSKLSPWKKIIKFLTAFIPIGLLLSALTPTIINVAPMNMTQGRGRAEQQTPTIAAEKLISSLNYINKLNSAGCEERVICELLMGAGSSVNAEQHVEHLLETFTEQERDVIDQIQELKKIFEAVKSGECSSLVCDKMQEGHEDDRDKKEDY